MVLEGFDPDTGCSRFGVFLQLNVRLHGFNDVFVLWLKWFSRRRAIHSRRVVILIDSVVLVGVVANGRVSSCLQHSLRKVVALELVGDLRVCLVLVPSKHNFADIFSRGLSLRQRRFGHGALGGSGATSWDFSGSGSSCCPMSFASSGY